MRYRVRSTLRTRLLFTAAVLASGIVAWIRVQQRIADAPPAEAQTTREQGAPDPHAGVGPADAVTFELEIAE